MHRNVNRLAIIPSSDLGGEKWVLGIRSWVLARNPPSAGCWALRLGARPEAGHRVPAAGFILSLLSCQSSCQVLGLRF